MIRKIKQLKISEFQEFHNLYSLSKTLRFELKPIGNTTQILEGNQVYSKDETIKKKYEATKPFFDRLHSEFISEALSGVSLTGLSEYEDSLVAWQKDKKNKVLKKAYNEKVKKLREEVVKLFDKKADDWASFYNKMFIEYVEGKTIRLKFIGDDGKKTVGTKIFSSKGVLGILLKKYPEIKTELYPFCAGFFGYFKKFTQTRENFYKDDGTTTALATRIIDQNLKRFCDNLALFDTTKVRVDFSEVGKVFQLDLSEFFAIEFYNNCLLQDGINYYNKIIGGETLENGEKIKGLNELINQYRQNNKDQKIPFFKLLDKQILGEKAVFLDEIKNDTELISTLKQFTKIAEEKTIIVKNLFSDFVENNSNYDLTKVYFSKEAFNTISNKWTTKTNIFDEELFVVLNVKETKEEYELLRKDKNDPKIGKTKDEYRFPSFIKLQHIKEALEKITEVNFWKEKYYKNPEDIHSTGFLTGQELVWCEFLEIFKYEFDSLFEREIINPKSGKAEIIGYDSSKKELDELFQNFRVDQKAKVIIKDFADSVLKIYQMSKYFAVEKKRAWDEEYELDSFYTHPKLGYLVFYKNAYEDIVQIYNKIRNYLTKKPYSEKKWKLNFDCSYLLSGWSSEFETYGSLLFEKNGKYYLGVINGKALAKEKLKKLVQGITKENLCKKMVYDFQKPDYKTVPRLFIRSKGESFAPAVKEFDLPVKSILEIYDQGLFKTRNSDNPLFKESLKKLINYFKLGFSKHNSYKHFSFKWKESSEYKNIADFYQDTIRSCYQLQWEDFNFDEIQKLTETKDLYLFQIYNKDFSDKSRGSKNLHSLYFQSLFLIENLENNDGVIFKLSGGGEIFFRRKTDVKKLGKRKDSNGNKVVKNKRYSENKIFLHFPIELNYARNKEGAFNTQVNNFLADNKNINIIGVDRGEKHLAYYSVVSQDGDILDSDSLNIIGGVNYFEKLNQKAEDREQSRKDWQDVQGIKDLKKGYISQVVRKLADLAIQHNAIIVLEDLNMRFKQVRGGIEKSVYQQLEKALIEKLNFLVNKGEKDPNQAGNLLKAYQLTAPFDTFQKMDKQTGIIFYTQSAYTSKIDPVTGWRPHLYLRYSSAKQAKDEIAKFKEIKFVNNRFEFTYDIKDFKRDQKEYPTKTRWTVCSNVERFRWNKSKNQNKGDYDHYEDLTDNFKNLFKEFDIDFLQKNIKEQISNLKVVGNEKFFKDFIFYFALICQIRNTDNSELAKKNGKDDFILSPVAPFFDSRKNNNKNLPINGDDNGAYNIGRKGIIILNKISEFARQNKDCDKIKWSDLYVSNTDWDDFVQFKFTKK